MGLAVRLNAAVSLFDLACKGVDLTGVQRLRSLALDDILRSRVQVQKRNARDRNARFVLNHPHTSRNR